MKLAAAFIILSSLLMAGCSNNEITINKLAPSIGHTGDQKMGEYAVPDRSPQPVEPITFDYPATAKKQGIRGYVRYQFIVNEEGSVDKIEIIESSHELLSESVIKTLQNSRFEPGMKEGQPVKVRLKGTVPFGV